MATRSHISGTQQVINNLFMAKDILLKRIGEAAEKTALDVANHAKAEHERGSGPHGQGRFESQTGTLIRSISSELTTINYAKAEAVVTAGEEYAANVELGTGKTKPYPFMWPALVASTEKFKERMEAAIDI